MENVTLRLDHLATGYRRGRWCVAVAKDLCATLPPATLTALVGTNGAGKTTLLRTIAGLQPRIGGSIEWQGTDITALSPQALACKVAVVLTDRVTAGMLTAWQTVALGRTPRLGITGRLTEDDKAYVSKVMQMTGTSQWAERETASLSDGERQRVMIAKALAQETPAILLDEPTAFLDLQAKVSLFRLLKRLAVEEKKTILFSTHDLEAAFQTADNLWLLSHDGITAGAPRTLAANGTLGRFFNSPDVTFEAGEMRFRLEEGNA